MLNPVDVPNHIMNFEEVTDHDEGNDAIHVALLHEVIMPTEVLDQAKEMKPDKASGPDGLLVVTRSVALNHPSPPCLTTFLHPVNTLTHG